MFVSALVYAWIKSKICKQTVKCRFFNRRKRSIYSYMENILFAYILTILFHMSKNEMVLRFEVVALNKEKQDNISTRKTKSLSEQPNIFMGEESIESRKRCNHIKVIRKIYFASRLSCTLDMRNWGNRWNRHTSSFSPQRVFLFGFSLLSLLSPSLMLLHLVHPHAQTLTHTVTSLTINIRWLGVRCNLHICASDCAVPVIRVRRHYL